MLPPASPTSPWSFSPSPRDAYPFRDFNGRTLRIFLLELLRRLDLPRVVLAAEGEAARATYFTALEAADQRDWRPLMSVWQDRFVGANTST